MDSVRRGFRYGFHRRGRLLVFRVLCGLPPPVRPSVKDPSERILLRPDKFVCIDSFDTPPTRLTTLAQPDGQTGGQTAVWLGAGVVTFAESDGSLHLGSGYVYALDAARLKALRQML